ncbi:MAG TPA: alpha/beta hydrolase [Puia sp.]|uniref:alpha/beta hydrolase n=1 Tax=Puia sp. TaxID=2045100 RepID=UPI002B9AF239|nr:alpha/beta hydrolase [Puia sp.]HVU94481.1 alpha/beta hydrolase [Puia sp.]
MNSTIVFLLTLLTAVQPAALFSQAKNYATDPSLSTAVKTFLKAVNAGPPLETLSPVAARKVLADAQASVPVDLSGIDVSEKTITGDGFTVRLNIVRPAGVTDVLPVFVYIHGGGWVLGDFPTHERMVRDLVVLSGAVGVFINYTPTPDAVFPTQINEIYTGVKWVAEHGADIGVDGSRLAIVGNSVGGNMTAVTALMAKDKHGPALRAQIMLWPILDADFNTGSYKEFGTGGYYLTSATMKWMYDMYIKDPAKRKNIYASPLRADIEELKGLPPAIIAVDENDILRDEGEAYGRKLDLAGVKVTTIRYDAVIHDFGLLNGLAEIPQTKSLFVQLAAELKNYLK